MKKNLFTKPLALLLSCLLTTSFLQISPLATDVSVQASRTPRLVSGFKYSADAEEVDGGELVTFTALFTDTQATSESVEISATNGGIIQASSINDIYFDTNGVKQDITDLEVSDDGDNVKFKTSTLSAKKTNKIVFQVESPLSETSFDVKIKIGTGTIGTGTKTIKVIPGLTIESPDEVNDEDSFYITGNARIKGKSVPNPSYIFVEILDKNTGIPMDEIQYTSEINDENRYSFGPITLSPYYDDGEYEINVYIMYDDLYILGSASKTIEFKKTATIITIKSANNDNINALEPFSVSGIAHYKGGYPSENSYVFLEIIHKDSGIPIDEIQYTTTVTDGKYEFDSIVIPSGYEEGEYFINVYLIHDDLLILCDAELTINLRSK